jgi:gliding motility-associated-like protein
MSYDLDKSTFTIADVSNSPITISLTVKDIYGNTTVTPVLVTFPIQIVTTQALTPNGDGINDTWIVENITNHPNSVVRVFNRWGSLVYSAKNYQNDWDGKLNGSDVTVPDGGSYYYQIDLNGTGNVDSEGWLYISRQ